MEIVWLSMCREESKNYSAYQLKSFNRFDTFSYEIAALNLPLSAKSRCLTIIKSVIPFSTSCIWFTCLLINKWWVWYFRFQLYINLMLYYEHNPAAQTIPQLSPSFCCQNCCYYYHWPSLLENNEKLGVKSIKKPQ